MVSNGTKWQIVCDQQTFEACRKDERFPFVLALARAMNALNFAHMPLIYAENRTTPDAQRDRLNSYFFASAILYEILALIAKMHKAFQNDAEFKNGLRLLAKGQDTQSLRQDNLDPLRNGAVFHFLPERFAETSAKATCNECPFIEADGDTNGSVYYAFADVITAEMLVGFTPKSDDLEEEGAFNAALEKAMVETREILLKFTNSAERLIVARLREWGFRLNDPLGVWPRVPGQATIEPST